MTMAKRVGAFAWFCSCSWGHRGGCNASKRRIWRRDNLLCPSTNPYPSHFRQFNNNKCNSQKINSSCLCVCVWMGAMDKVVKLVENISHPNYGATDKHRIKSRVFNVHWHSDKCELVKRGQCPERWELQTGGWYSFCRLFWRVIRIVWNVYIHKMLSSHGRTRAKRSFIFI